jgi:hypothetical protein
MWAQAKYGVELPLAHVQGSSVRKLREELIGYQREWLTNGKIDKLADEIVAKNPTTEELARALNQRFGWASRRASWRSESSRQERSAAAGRGCGRARSRRATFVVRSVREFLRKELSDLEQAC